MPWLIRIQLLVDKAHFHNGLLDTSVIIDLEQIPEAHLPIEVAVSALTLAELSAGLLATDDLQTRVARQLRLQNLESLVEVLPFDAHCARAYASVFAAARTFGRKPRGSRAVDYMIAATAMQHKLPLFTRNPKDFEGLEDLLQIIAV